MPMDPLKFVVLDEEDLEVASAHLQDAVLKVSDILWRAAGKARRRRAQPVRLGERAKQRPWRRAAIPAAAVGLAFRARAVLQVPAG